MFDDPHVRRELEDARAEQAHPSKDEIKLWREKAKQAGVLLRAYRPGAGFELSSDGEVHQLATWDEVKTWVMIYHGRAGKAE